MFFRLLILFTVVPAVELYLLIQLGQLIGPLATVGIILLTGFVGAAFAKREGLSVLRQIQADLREGVPPAGRLLEGLMVLLGGALLLTPGVLTDVFGFSLILPWTRPALARLVGRALSSRFTIAGAQVHVGAPGPGPAHRGPFPGDLRGEPRDEHVRVRTEEDRERRRERGGDGFDHPVS